MKAVRGALGVAVWLFVLAAGLYGIHAAWRGAEAWDLTAWIADRGEWSMPLAILTVGLAVLWPLSLVTRTPAERHLAFRNPDGEVRVRLDAIRDYLGRLASEFAGVESLRSVVSVKAGGLAIDLHCRVQVGRPVAEISRSLQERAKACIQNDLGIAEIHSIDVTVREFVGTPPARDPMVRAPRPGESASFGEAPPPA
jgi:hypothetical protein